MKHGEKRMGYGFLRDREKPLGGRILKRVLIFKREERKAWKCGLQKRKKKKVF